jgi:hypothetical protein
MINEGLFDGKKSRIDFKHCVSIFLSSFKTLKQTANTVE